MKQILISKITNKVLNILGYYHSYMIIVSNGICIKSIHITSKTKIITINDFKDIISHINIQKDWNISNLIYLGIVAVEKGEKGTNDTESIEMRL